MASLWEDIKREVNSTGKYIGKTGKNLSDSLTGDDDRRAALDAEKKRLGQKKDDKKKFSEFQNQDFLDPQSDLYVPNYSRSPQLRKKQEEMLSLFNARKDEILARQATPGIAQTRF